MVPEGVTTRAEDLIDTRAIRAGAWLYRRTHGRITRLWRRRSLLLTTTDRKTGLSRTAIIRFFLSVGQVEDLWPRVHATAPNYARYRRCPDRAIPLLRLIAPQALPDGWPQAESGTVDAGTCSPGMSYLAVGVGPPLLFLPGLTAHHEVPRGMDRAAAIGAIRELSRGRQVWWVNRRAGLPQAVTVADLAADYAAWIRTHFDKPVDVVGMSTGGSVALQLTADHPELVRRLVLVCAACRLGPRGKAGQRVLARALEAGRRRRAGAAMLATLGTPLTEPMWTTMGWLLGPWMFRHDHSDLLVTLAAEDAFDLTDILPRIQTPVLVVGGDHDQPYGPALFAETAQRLPHGRLLLYRHASHVTVVGRRHFASEVLGFLNGDRLPGARSKARTHVMTTTRGHPGTTGGGSATVTTVRVFGLIAALTGIEHGLGEISQGPATARGVVFESWPHVAAFDPLNGEPAMSLIPNLLISGIASVLVSVALGVVAGSYSHRAHSGSFILGVSLLLLLVGGGFGPPLLGVLAGVLRTRIDAPPAHPTHAAARIGAVLWPWLLLVAAGSFLGLVPGTPLLYAATGRDISTLVAVLTVAAFTTTGLAMWAGRARDHLDTGRGLACSAWV